MSGSDSKSGEIPVCPFIDPHFVMDPEKPCPVCGDLGTFATLDDSNCEYWTT